MNYQIACFCLLNTAQPPHLPGKSVIDIGRHCLKIPGRLLDLSTLLDKKKFRAYDNKEGALRGFHSLQADGLGCLEVKRGRGNSKVNIIVHLSPCICQCLTYSLTNFGNKHFQLMMMMKRRLR